MLVDEVFMSRRTIIHAVQEETYAQEYACLRKEKFSKDSPLKALDHFIDADGLRVRGPIRQAENAYYSWQASCSNTSGQVLSLENSASGTTVY